MKVTQNTELQGCHFMVMDCHKGLSRNNNGNLLNVLKQAKITRITYKNYKICYNFQKKSILGYLSFLGVPHDKKVLGC